VCDIAGERNGVARRERDRLIRDLDRDRALLDLRKLLRAGRMGLAVMPVSRA
jgi:hypothetical protein